jgi:streptogramin lyase
MKRASRLRLLACGLACAALVGGCGHRTIGPRASVIDLPRGTWDELTVDSDGSLWLGSVIRTVARVDPGGRVHVVTLPGNFLTSATALAPGPNGSVYYASYGGAGSISSNGRVVSHADPFVSVTAAAARGGDVWFGGDDSPRPSFLDRLARGRIARVRLRAGVAWSFVNGLAVDREGDVWAAVEHWGTKAGTNALVRLDDRGRVTRTWAEPGGVIPTEDTVAADGSVWFAEDRNEALGHLTRSGRVVQVPLPRGVAASDITSTRDGSVWFVSGSCAGRIREHGGLALWNVDGAKDLQGVAAGPDGRVWAVDQGANVVRQLVPPAKAAPSCRPPLITRRSGSTIATLYPCCAGGEVVIRRAGKVRLAVRLPRYEGNVSVEQDRSRVTDLDGDGEPEVIVPIDSGGAHCCTSWRVYRWVAATRRYEGSEQMWGDTTSAPRMIDLNHDGRPELVAKDDRFAYAFDAGFAGSLFPIQIWSYRDGRFVDVTRHFPNIVERDAAGLMTLYRRNPITALTALPAWAADQASLGHPERIWPAFAAARVAGHLSDPSLYPKGADAYLREVHAFLRKLGYLRS